MLHCIYVYDDGIESYFIAISVLPLKCATKDAESEGGLIDIPGGKLIYHKGE